MPSLTSGAFERDSIQTNVASSTAATAASPSVRPEPKPHVWALTIA
jgi:hypothetical protein